jgi:hypothetical protein
LLLFLAVLEFFFFVELSDKIIASFTLGDLLLLYALPLLLRVSIFLSFFDSVHASMRVASGPITTENS